MREAVTLCGVHILFLFCTLLCYCVVHWLMERERAGPHWRVLAGYSLTELRLYKKLKEETDGEEGRGGD